MDKIYLPKTDLPIVHLDQRHHEHRTQIADFPGLLAPGSDLEAAIGWPGTADEFALLDESVSLDQLGDAHDLRICPYDPSTYRPDKLSSLSMPTKAVATLRTLSGMAAYNKQYSISQRHRYQKLNKYRHIPMPDTDADGESDTIEPGAELLVVVRVYEPFKYVCVIAGDPAHPLTLFAPIADTCHRALPECA